MRQGCTHRSRIAVADSYGTRLADVLVVLLEFPEPLRPSAHCVASRNQGPVFVLYLSPQLCRNSGCADWAVIPTIGRAQPILFHSFLAGGGNFRSPGLKESFSVGRDEPLDLFDQ